MFLYTKGTRETVVPAWFSVVPAVLGTTSKLHNIYVFICKRHLKQRGSCVVQRGSSSVLKGGPQAKTICNTFNIQQVILTDAERFSVFYILLRQGARRRDSSTDADSFVLAGRIGSASERSPPPGKPPPSRWRSCLQCFSAIG